MACARLLRAVAVDLRMLISETIQSNLEISMNAKMVRTLALSIALLGASAVSMAAAGAGGGGSPGSSSQSREHGSMMMGTGGMMGGCPMMGGTTGMDPKTAMRMHGEMMRAMGDIMLKYSDQAGAAPSK